MLTLPRSKKLAILIVVLLAISSVSFYYIRSYYQEQEQATLSKARTDMIRAQAAANNIKLLSDSEIKNITAINTGVTLDQLTFKEVSLITFDDLPHEPPHNERYNDGPRVPNEPNAANQTTVNQTVASSATSKINTEAQQADLPQDAKDAINKRAEYGNPPGDKKASHEGLPVPDGSDTAVDREKPQIPNYSRTHPNELRKHPLYRIVATSKGVTYDLLIDAVNGHILRSTVR